MKLILKYFKNITKTQTIQFQNLYCIYKKWNAKINVISRKDIDNIYEKHVLHSLAIAKFINFTTGTKIIDVGTGGGFPGIPLAIIFPEVEFTLIDSTAKKIKVVDNIVNELGLKNVKTYQKRSNEFNRKFDFITGRAVSSFPKFKESVKHLISKKNKNKLPNGILYLKGGDFENEITNKNEKIIITNINNYFKEDFFETKKIIY